MNRNFRTVVFARPEISKADRKAVDRVLKSGWITTGSAAARFEEEFRKRLNVPFAWNRWESETKTRSSFLP